MKKMVKKIGRSRQMSLLGFEPSATFSLRKAQLKICKHMQTSPGWADDDDERQTVFFVGVFTEGTAKHC
jgi:hypothetical protein